MDAQIPRTDAAGEEALTVLQRIELKDAKESFPKGDAEIFAVISGVGMDGQPKVTVRQLPFLTAANQPRTPNMDLIHWSDFASRYVNIHLFERDGDLDFNVLARTLVGSVGDLGGLLIPGAPANATDTGGTTAAGTDTPVEKDKGDSDQGTKDANGSVVRDISDAAGKVLSVATGRTAAALSLVSKIGDAVLDSMGTRWLKDDHDYVDSFYTIERGEYYKDRLGAARNAKVTLKPVAIG
jgi:hypothetical protein